MATSKRIYIVREHNADGTTTSRMVKAATAAQAIRHVVEPRFVAEVGSAEACALLGAGGIKVEDAAS